ncbi:MAG: STAS domain-containing protein [Sulfuricellaceae bacterium]
MAMQINTSVSGQTGRIVLGGRFDFTSQQQLRANYAPLLHDERVRLLEVDLGGVEFMDSTAMGMLLLLKERAAETGKQLALTNCQGTPLTVLRMAHFNRIFDMRCEEDIPRCAFYSR